MPAISASEYDPPPVPASCAGCGGKITDRYYLLAVDRPWHVGCLKCRECKGQLDSALTCFARDGNIYCKEDYYRLFAVKRCARCQRGIFANELVMRARDLVYHLHCFTCAWCNAALTQGDYFGLRDNLVYCRTHYELLLQGEAYGTSASVGSPPADNPAQALTSRCPVVDPSGLNPLHGSGHQNVGCERSDDSMMGGIPSGGLVSSVTAPYSHGAVYPPVHGGTVRKGRPRKRKQTENHNALDGSTTNSLGVPLLDPSGHCGLHMSSGLSDSSSPTGGSNGLLGNGQGPPGPGGGHSQRTKRMRTSFKHHQLRTMKSYFSINQNPDAKDLKQLAQKTGLSKRVLQVWFQNARAKWRRNNLKQDQPGQPGSQSGTPSSGQQSTGTGHHRMGIMPGSPGGTSSFSEASPGAPCGGMGPDTPTGGPHSHQMGSMDYNGSSSLMGHHHVSDSMPLTSFQELF